MRLFFPGRRCGREERKFGVGANSNNLSDVKARLRLLSRRGLSQLSHKVLALDADLPLLRLRFWPLLELATAASRLEALAANSTD